jgi:hypothetical protein
VVVRACGRRARLVDLLFLRANDLSHIFAALKTAMRARKTAMRARAPALEGYPIDTSAPKSTSNIFTGTAAAFARAGFKVVARRASARPIMRHDLKADAAPMTVNSASRIGDPVHARFAMDGGTARAN